MVFLRNLKNGVLRESGGKKHCWRVVTGFIFTLSTSQILLVYWSVMLVDDYPIFTQEKLVKY